MSKAGKYGKLVKSYTVNTEKNDNLEIPQAINNLTNQHSGNLELTISEGFTKNYPVSAFQLKFKNTANQKKFNNLVKLLKTTVSTKFYNQATDGTKVTGNFPMRNKNILYLQIIFGSIEIGTRINCGAAIS